MLAAEKERVMIARTSSLIQLLVAGFVMLFLGSAHVQELKAQPEHVPDKKSEYSPYVGQHFPQRVYWGDTHHHSSYSFDSGMFGLLCVPGGSSASPCS